jgi:serine/threonine protein kinase
MLNGLKETGGDELRPGTTLLHGQYTIDSYLSSGGFGVTYLARDSLDRMVVIKECFPSAMCCRNDDSVRVRSRSNQQDFEKIVGLFGREARALAKLAHPNIVGVHQVFEDNDTAYMALDYVEGRELLDVIEQARGALGPAEVRALLMRMLSAVAYIHERDILHRDISPDNILIDQRGEPILIDFGAAREQATRASRVLSSLHTVKDGYSPQEFYLAGGKQFPCSDLYALAATFHHVLTGEPPVNSQVRLAAIAEKKPDPYAPLVTRVKGYDRYFLEAIDKALSVFPKDRLQSAAEWVEMIDTEKRRRAALERAKRDRMLEQAIVELVESTPVPEPGHGPLPREGRGQDAAPRETRAAAPAVAAPRTADFAVGEVRPRRRTSVLAWMWSGALSRLARRGASSGDGLASRKD